jgi:LysR family hydrogen peroxide-inducible transcriptional activator
MQTHELRYFISAARLLNFTKAASECGVSQPALTRAIQKLETNLGGELFYRRQGRIELTALGRRLLPKFEEIQRGLADITQDAKLAVEENTTTLRLGVVCTIAPTHIVRILGRLREQFPDAEISIQEVDAPTVLGLLLTNEIEIGITAQPDIPDEVAFQPLFNDGFEVALPDGHPLCAGDVVELSQLEGEPYLERLNCEFDAYFEATQGRWPFKFRMIYASEREDWIQELIASGHGCAIIPGSIKCLPGIVRKRLVGPEIRRTVGLVSLRGRQLSMVGQSFLRLAATHRWTIARTP